MPVITRPAGCPKRPPPAQNSSTTSACADLGNIEFKRDPRDGKLKVIEVNARFTAAQELVRRAGVPIDLIVYRHLTKQPLPDFEPVKEELRMWYPLRDFLGFTRTVAQGRSVTLGLAAQHLRRPSYLRRWCR